MPNKITELYDSVCNLIIRPERHLYDPSLSLGPRLFSLERRIYERRDFTVENSRGMNLQCSHFQPIEQQRKSEKLPCVIYLHGNCGSRVDSLPIVEVLLPHGITVLAFDFSGSGLSDGDYVSLGFFEKQDVSDIVSYLWSTKRVSRIGLWGRSMGAATTLMYASIDKGISALVTDSPFTSLHDLINEIVWSAQSWVPKSLIVAGISVIGRRIQSKAGFDIELNNPIRYVSRCRAPIIMAHAMDDNFIRIQHTIDLFQEYGGYIKSMVILQGDHNSPRDDEFYQNSAEFLHYWLVWRPNFVTTCFMKFPQKNFFDINIINI
jgi:dipeptidyl aminopeptidase/acylaminoacyl peptidase